MPAHFRLSLFKFPEVIKFISGNMCNYCRNMYNTNASDEPHGASLSVGYFLLVNFHPLLKKANSDVLLRIAIFAWFRFFHTWIFYMLE